MDIVMVTSPQILRSPLIRHQLMGWSVERWELELNIRGRLVSTTAIKIKSLLSQAHRYRLIKSKPHSMRSVPSKLSMNTLYIYLQQ